MTTGSGILNDIFVIWLPIIFALLLAALGFVRGVRREAIVSLAVVLGGLILTVWASSWATDVASVIPGLAVADWQATLGYIVMGLVVLAAGYGLASALVTRGPITAASRLGGFLLGLANGAAIAGWIMRNHYLALRDSGAADSAQTMDMLYRTPVSFGLILWSGWFPLVVAAAAAIIAIVGPARRVRPTTLEDWTPPATAAPAPPPTLGVPPAAGPGATPSQPPSGSTPYGGAAYGGAAYGGSASRDTSAGSTSVLAETRPTAYGARVPERSPGADSPPTMPMPGSEGRPLYSGGQETLNLGLADRPSSAPAPDATVPSRPASDHGSATPDTHATTPNPTTLGEGPSWLAAPMSTGRTDPALDRQPTGERDSLVSRSEAPTVEQPVMSTGSEAIVTCPNCGSREFASAAFCTQCGTRLKTT
jgi:uncharacterized membrane protein required for colicin V production